MEEYKELLAKHGWQIDCFSPFEISEMDGSGFATNHAAWIILRFYQQEEEKDANHQS